MIGVILKILNETQKIEMEVNDCPCGVVEPPEAPAGQSWCEEPVRYEPWHNCACCMSGVVTLEKMKKRALDLVGFDHETGRLIGYTAEEEAALEALANEQFERFRRKRS